MSFDDDAVGIDDQQASQRSLAHLRRDPEALLATDRTLPGRKAEPGHKIARLAECLR